ncbi:MAG: peptidase and in kexin sedolisin [Gemmatimonadetes bacterium]|nr:peptidase and in kexin sedolisin [Gemmatimonadota bacterium]
MIVGSASCHPGVPTLVVCTGFQLQIDIMKIIFRAVALVCLAGFATLGAQVTSIVPLPEAGPARNWHQLDLKTDGVPGISSERAMKELLAGVQPKRTVIVAVIDGGTDTAHVDLRANLWTNPKEIAGNAKDDDGNGYADDIRGWDFIGGKDGRDVGPDTHEVTRLAARCKAGTSPYPPETCKTIMADFERERAEVMGTLAQVKKIDTVSRLVSKVLSAVIMRDSLTVERVQAIVSNDPEVQRAKSVFLQLNAQGLTRKEIDDGLKEYESRAAFGLNPDFDSRKIVGDNYADLTERYYGNNDVTGPDALHGTHVAGIIGAVRGNNIGIDGIAPAVRLMIVRTVPDGDERDKDVANAIRYAADNGANVINMSFGKGYSPEKKAVDDAVKYADAKGVLMIHAAGNDGEDNSKKVSFPTSMYEGGGRAQNWIEVGASSWKTGDSLVATFSNYSKSLVDVFAPGVDIYSTVAGGKYARDSGTSMAAPVVTGVAALLMGYFPNLTAADVKRIILTSATSHATEQVAAPGGKGSVAFGTLSATGAIVNAYEAVKMAQSMGALRP